MNFDRIFKHILSNPSSYPGKFLKANYNKLTQKEMDSLSQFHIIFDCVIENIRNNLLEGKSVFVKGETNLEFGMFGLKVEKGFNKNVMKPKNINTGNSKKISVHFVPKGLLKSKLINF